MNITTNIISDCFNQSLKNAFGSKANFEKELVYKAFECGNKGKLYFTINKYLNFKLAKNINSEEDFVLLICNLDICDIYNFVEDIDYFRLEKSYLHFRNLIESKQIIC